MTPATTRPVNGAPAGYRDVIVCGTEDQVAALVRHRSDAGLLVAMSAPRPHRGGVAARLRLRHQPGRVVAVPGPVAAPPRPRRRTEVDRRQLVGTAVLAGGAVAGVTVAAVLAVRGLAAAATWATANPGPIVAVLLAVAAVAWLLTRAGGSSSGGGGGGCAGVHCSGCSSH